MSAEELKAAIREYADEHLPGWRVASLSIRIGGVLDNPDEQLVVIASPAQPQASREKRRPQGVS